jgi:hypothetical protein
VKDDTIKMTVVEMAHPLMNRSFSGEEEEEEEGTFLRTIF